ncbi:MAG TPA: YraN family protein [Clostridiaceae bacterium]|nr:YraN family protein [Clostridiaceae bacterium]
MKTNNKNLGNIGEKAAIDFLCKNNYHIIHTNFRAGKLGEIDIVARENEYICFIEVKTRSSLSFGIPSESVTSRKQNVIRKVAAVYLSRNHANESSVRFDIVEVYVKRKAGEVEITQINLIKNAF